MICKRAAFSSISSRQTGWEMSGTRILEALFRENTKAIVCTHASNLTGNVLDIARISEIAHARGALLIVDASQSAGVIPIDMQKMDIDVLCFTGHKRAHGTAGNGRTLPPSGRGDKAPSSRAELGVHSYDKDQPQAYPTRLEAGTLNSHGLAGLDAALGYFSGKRAWRKFMRGNGF